MTITIKPEDIISIQEIEQPTKVVDVKEIIMPDGILDVKENTSPLTTEQEMVLREDSERVGTKEELSLIESVKSEVNKSIDYYDNVFTKALDKKTIGEYRPELLEEELIHPYILDTYRVLLDTAENIVQFPFRVADAGYEAITDERLIDEQTYRDINKMVAGNNPITVTLKGLGGLPMMDSLGDYGDAFYTELVDERGDFSPTETGYGLGLELGSYFLPMAGQWKLASKYFPKFMDTTTGKVAAGTTFSATTDVLLQDPNDQRIVDMVTEITGLPDSELGLTLVEALSADENDTLLKQKGVAALEGLGLGLAFSGGITLTVALGKLSIALGKKGSSVVADAIQHSKNTFGKNLDELNDEEAADVMLNALEESRITTNYKGNPKTVNLSETPQGSSQVALQNNSAINRFMRRFFTSRGYFTPRAYNAKMDAEFSQRQTIALAENIANRLDKAAKNLGESTEQKEVLEIVNKALTDDLTFLKNIESPREQIIELADRYNLPDDIAKEVINARTLIDDLSKQLIDSPSVSDSLKETINENVGVYMRRSYRLFEDNNYKPTPAVQKDAIDYVYNTLLKNDPNISEEFAYQTAKDTVDEILSKADVNNFVDYFAKLKKVNTDILKQKEDIAPEIRALMGEIKNPTDNIVLTVSKMSNLVNTSKFYENLEVLGRTGNYIFKEGQPRDNKIYSVKITGTNSSLDGQYTTPEILAQINNQVDRFQLLSGIVQSKGYRTLLTAKGGVQKMKTVYSHVTHLRNFIGGGQFMFFNGNNPFKGGREVIQTLKDNVRQGGDAELNALYEKYLRLGVVNTNTRVGEFRAILDNGLDTEQLEKAIEKNFKGISDTAKFVEKVYTATDDLFKIMSYNQELDVLIKAYPDQPLEVLEEQAASIVRNTIPNYDRVPQGVRALRDLPLGSYFSFPAEITRTAYNVAKQAALEVRSSNPIIQERGRKRAAGMLVTGFGAEIIASTTASLAGFDSEDQRAIEILTSKPWSPEHSPKGVVRIGDELFTIDLQYIDSYNTIKDPFYAAYSAFSQGTIEEKEFEQKMFNASVAAFASFVKPYVSETILSDGITDVTRAFFADDGRTSKGKEMFTPGLSFDEKMQNLGVHFFETIMPGSATSLINLADAAQGNVDKNTGKPKSFGAELTTNTTGIKFNPLHIDTHLKYAVNTYKEEMSNSISIGINFARTSEEILKRYEGQQDVRLDASRRLYKSVMAANHLLGNDDEAFETVAQYLLDAGLSNNDIKYIVKGRFKPSMYPKSLVETTLEKTPDVEDKESVIDLNKELQIRYNYYSNIHLIDPVTMSKETLMGGEIKDIEKIDERLKKVMGGKVSNVVPNAPINPSERINKVTGVPYNLEAGAAFLEETNPLRSLLMAKGGRVKYYSGGAFVAKFLGITEEDLEFAKNQDKRYPENEKMDGRGDAARHLALGWITQRTPNPERTLKAANFRENLSLRRLDKPMDVHNNNLGATIKAETYKEAEKEIDRLIKENKAIFMSPKESAEMRGYNIGGKVLKSLMNNKAFREGAIKSIPYKPRDFTDENFREAMIDKIFTDEDLINTHPSEMSDAMLEAAQRRINEDETFAKLYRAGTDYNEREKFSRGKLIKKGIEFFAPKKESGMYSAAEKASQKLEGSKPREGQAFLNEIKKDPNVTEEELTWTGANEKFANNKKVTKEEVQDFFKENDFDYDVYVGKHEPDSMKMKDAWFESDDDELFDFDKWMKENYPQEHTMMEEVSEQDSDAWYEMHEKFWDEWSNSKSFSHLSGKNFITNPEHIHFSFEGEDTVNYREMVLALPEKFKKVEKDYEHPMHFLGIKNPILHIRFADIKEVKSPNTKTLLIDEVQSDKSTAAKELGYAFSNDEYIIPNEKTIKKLDKEYDTLVEEMEDLEEILEGMTNAQLASKRGKTITSELESIKNKMKENAEAQQILKEADEEVEFKIPTLPLKKEKNWATVGLRKALITAAEEGYDQVALTTGRIQALRNAKIGDINEAILYKREGDSSGWALQGVSTNEGLDDFFVGFDTYEEAVAKLPKIIGKQNADELLASTPNTAGDYSLKKNMTFERGGQKFYEFYDKSLPKILNKQFGEKYGVEIKMVKYKQKDKTVELPTLKITDKMREDILKGLKMFVEGGLVEET